MLSVNTFRPVRFLITTIAVLACVGAAGCDVVSIFGASEATYEVASGKTDHAVRPFTELRHNDCAAADKDFTDAIVGNPKDPRAYAGRAEARLCLGKYNDAIADYTTAIQMDPKWFDYFGRGMAYRAIGQPDPAVSDFDHAIALNGNVPAPYVYRGVVLKSQGKSAAAEDDFAKALSLTTARPWKLNAYAWMLATDSISPYRDGAAAIQYATKACDGTFWKQPATLDTLAAAYAEDGQFDTAIRWQKQAINALPANASAKAHEVFEKRLAMYEQKQPYRDKELPLFF